MAALCSHLSIITLNINGLTSPIKRQREPGWVRNQDPVPCCLQDTPLSSTDTQRLKEKGWKMKPQESGSQRKAGRATLISDRRDLKPKGNKGQRWTLMIKGRVDQEDIKL